MLHPSQSNSLQTQEHGTKRRKVRKGTKNCWECKRRKVRCMFSSANASTCDNCQRRGSTCVSQEYEDAPSGTFIPSDTVLETCLDRDGARMDQPDGQAHPRTKDLPGVRPTSSRLEETLEALPPIEQNTSPDQSVSARPETSDSLPMPAIAYIRTTDERHTEKYDNLVRELLAVWPSQEELDLIYTLPVGLSTYLHRGICAPYSSHLNQDPPRPQELLQLPPPGSHPVLIARKLLLLGTFLQGVLPSSIEKMGTLGVSYRQIMTRVVDRAILVTTNDELISCVEGIECIMLEAHYQNYGGNLHKSWLAMRRATAVAQLLGLHRGFDSPSLKILQPETRVNVDLDQMFFRLFELDGYLSLMLGLPPTSLEERFVSSELLDDPVDRLQRIHVAAGRRILLSNGLDVKSFETVQDIDRQLQRAAAGMSPQWWLAPTFLPQHEDGVALLHDTIKLMDQFTHFHLLTRLHLPYMLRYANDHRYDYSKITAITSSREILSRYVAFRTSNPAHFYCRGTDFLAFVACTVMCLAHTQSRGQCQLLAAEQTTNAVSSFHGFLPHSRPSDRGMMERAQEIIASLSHTSDDGVASKLSRSIQNLLIIEDNAANGTLYLTSSSRGENADESRVTNSGLHVHIPYFGTINFETGSISKHPQVSSMDSHSVASDALQRDLPNNTTDVSSNLGALQAYQSGDQFGLSGLRVGQTTPLLSDQRPMASQPSALNQMLNFDGSNGQAQLHMEYPIADPDWELQGVDVALFDRLFRGIDGENQ
ncbi:hypothetical protein K491DRAFT_373253 [Lophiostoma macrostomum CBS 122681]|uniref:Zn(2)-C6 fungal-type domain-containing protein n=1 Tax=Lophiostoma macrostomum CBS 122681 TaxID=1314788 RepID=A0A6A6TC75_9PLEO|nr:hypothetical protein K491DRAFT_373253 [Lophiostoma macrostomum CBS 122681]